MVARAAGAELHRRLVLAGARDGADRPVAVHHIVPSRLLEGSALANLGELEEARNAFADASRMYIAAGDRWDAVNSATNLAYVLVKSGDSAGAKKIYEDSLATYKELGDRVGTAAALISMANLLRSEGILIGAKRMHEQALAIYREIGDRVGEARALNNLANVFGLGGDLPSAEKTYEAALPVFRETGDRNGAATVLGNLADLLAEWMGRPYAWYRSGCRLRKTYRRDPPLCQRFSGEVFAGRRRESFR